MAKVIISASLVDEIKKKFSEQKGNEIIDLFETLEQNPKKGKELGAVGKFVIKELKFENFRFYFVTEGFKIKFLKSEELKDLVIKFVRMSNKNEQQKTIDEIKKVLRNLGGDGF